VPDQTVTIVDADGHQVVDGEVGEFVVASRYLALGYWREPELTAHAFAVDPADPEGRIFRTGDMGRRRPDGLFEFVGRKDQQIKLHGHRIEPAEIESALTALRDVRDAAVVIRYSEAGLPLAIVSYVVLRPGIRGLLPRHLQSILAQRLPRHMVPSQIMLVGDLPRLPNFKIDRQQLAHLDAEQSIRPRDHLVEPLINEIAGIIEAVLGVSNATADDNVASLGGDSLQEVSAMAELERQYAMRIPADVIEQRLTIRQIADWVASQKTHDVRVRVI
jgi:acyl carrier protein